MNAPEGNGSVAIRVEDMTHDHRLGLLTWLRGKARSLHSSVFTELHDAPDDVWLSHEHQPPAEWLEEQDLVEALVRWTTPYGEAPLTWQPMNTCPWNRIIRVRDTASGAELLTRVVNNSGGLPCVKLAADRHQSSVVGPGVLKACLGRHHQWLESGPAVRQLKPTTLLFRGRVGGLQSRGGFG